MIDGEGVTFLCWVSLGNCVIAAAGGIGLKDFVDLDLRWNKFVREEWEMNLNSFIRIDANKSLKMLSSFD